MKTAKQAGLRVGDIITVTVNPTITITQFDRFKPFASVTRTIQSDNEDIDSLREIVAHECMANLNRELSLAKKFDGLSVQMMARKVKRVLKKGMENGGHEIVIEKSSGDRKNRRSGKAD